MGRAFTEPGVHGPVMVRVRHADGSWRYLEAIGNNLMHNPAVRGVVVAGRDVTERVLAEEALRHSDERFRALVQNLSDVITIVGPDGRLIYSSPAAKVLFGFEEDDDTWSDPMAHIHPDEVERVVGEMTERLSIGSIDPVSFRLRVADGSYKDVEAIVQDLTDDPSVGGIVATTRDVTERARVELVMASQAQILRLIAEGAPLAETLATICGVVEHQLPDALCSVMLVDEADHVLRLGAAPSLPPEFSRATDLVPIGPSVGSCGTAAHYGTPIVVEDIRTDPRWDGYRTIADEHGLRACWSTPVMASSGDRVLGTFAVYNRAPVAPTPEAVEIVAMVSPLAAIAIERKTFEDRLAYQAQHDPLTGLPNRVLFVEFLTTRAGPRAAPADHLGGALPRPRPLQGRERQPRSRRRRRAPGALSSPALRGRAPRGHDRALRRRRVHRALRRPVARRRASRGASTSRERLLDVIEAPIAAQRRGPAPRREHRHRARRSGRHPGDPAARRRRRDVPGEGRGQGPLRAVRRRDAVVGAGSGSRPRPRCTARSSVTSCGSYYQPIIELGDGTLFGRGGARALAAPRSWSRRARRVHRSGRGDRSHRSDRRWVLAKARAVSSWSGARAARSRRRSRWRSTSRRASSRQADLVGRVAAVLERTGAPPERVCLEITESVLMAESTIEAIDALHALGVRLGDRRLRHRLLVARLPAGASRWTR